MWRARRARGGWPQTVVVRARHRLLPWRTITVETRDLRYGYEAVARYLSGGPVGFRFVDSRWGRVRLALPSRVASARR